MGHARFDELTRTVAAEGTRHQDNPPFAPLTRRLVLGGVPGSLLTLLGRDATAGKRGSKARTRCKKRRRAFCAGRCCPAGQACAGGACANMCADPFSCAHQSGGLSCPDEENCFCAQTPNGIPVCTTRLKVLDCEDLTSCSGAGDCPAGKVCATCFCDIKNGMPDNDFRCHDPCF